MDQPKNTEEKGLGRARSLTLIAFSINLPSVLRSTMGQKTLELLYNGLLGFEMIIDMDFLKYNGQWLRLIYIFAILTILAVHLRLLTIFLR